MRARVEEIDARLPECRSELLTLADGDLGESEATRFDELEGEHTSLTGEREKLSARLAQIDSVRETARNAQVQAEQASDDERVRSAAARGVESGGGRSRATRLDPFENLDAVRTNAIGVSDLRARALNAVERERSDSFSDGQREKVTSLIERSDRHGRIAKHILLTGSDAYTRAFTRMLEGAEPYQLEADELDALRTAEEYNRASMAEGSGNTGGYLVPFYLDPTVMLQNAGSTNPFRQISRVEAVTTNTWHGIASTGVVAGWLGEHAEASNNSPSFSQPTVNVYKAAAYLQASFEVTQDTNVAAQVGMMLADAKDNLEATAFAVGTGSSQPQGVVPGVAATSGSIVSDTSADSTAHYVVDDVYNVASALPPRYRPNASWVMNNSVQLLTRQFATGSGPQHAFWADLGMNTPPQLLGRPLYESSAMDDTVANGKNIAILGDFRNYLIADRIGMTVQYEPLVMGPSRMPTGEVGWFAHWRVGAGVLNPDAFRVLQIVTT